jgi:hypothetical protein
MDDNEIVITRVEVSNLMGKPALILHFVGDSNDLPDEIADSARAFAKEIWPDEPWEPHQVPLGSQCCTEQPTECSLMVAIKLSDAINLGVNVHLPQGKLELDY